MLAEVFPSGDVWGAVFELNGKRYNLGHFPKEWQARTAVNSRKVLLTKAHRQRALQERGPIRNRVTQRQLDQARHQEATLTPAHLRHHLDYDSHTGRLTHAGHALDTDCPLCATRAASENAAGTRYIIIDGTPYIAARVIWCMQTGAWPLGEVSYGNGNKADLSWSNLTLAAPAQKKASKPVRNRQISLARTRFESY